MLAEDGKQTFMVTKVPLGNNTWDLMTTEFATLLNKADKDYLVDSVLAGIPTSTKVVLGKKPYAITDLQHLPRLTDSVYIDVVETCNAIFNGQGIGVMWYHVKGDPEPTMEDSEVPAG